MKHIKHYRFAILFFALIGFFLTNQCTKPTPFGADLLDDQLAEYDYTDTLTLRCTVVPEDSLITSDRSSTADYMLCGQLNDPAFGRSESEIFTLFRLSTLNPGFKNATVDSIAMFLRYDAPGFYGDTTQSQTLHVHRLADNTVLRWDADYYSNQSLPVGPEIGKLENFLPKPNISADLFGDTLTRGPYIRIPLDNAFGQEILGFDSLNLVSDTAFWIKMRGLRITAESAGSPGAMMAFDLNNTTFSRIRLYYKQPQDTVSRVYDFSFIGGNKFNHFTHDYTGATVEPYLNQPAEDRLFVQGMGGLRVKVELPTVHLLDNIAVNKAELELTAITQAGDLLSPAAQLVFTESVGDTIVTLTSDVLYSLGSTLTGGFNGFGGFPQTMTDNGQSIQRYHLTLTRRFQDMVDNTSGNIKDQTVYLNVYPQSRSAMRAMFFGPKNATFPAKLALKYTRVK